MAVITYLGESYTVDHAVKGADFIHGYDANSVMIVSFEGIKDFSGFTYSGTYMEPGSCLAESCNDVKYVDGGLKKADGTPISVDDGSAVKKTGDTMTGDLVISKSAPALKLVSTTGGRTAHFWVSSDGNTYMRNSLDDNNRSSLYLQPETVTDFGRVLRLQKMVDGTATYYNIFGEHNKPDGSYTGNGSSTERVINLGVTAGTTDMVVIYSEDGTSLITRGSGLYFNATTASNIANSNARVETQTIDGRTGVLVLVLNTTHAGVNRSSNTYYWRVL